jgi:hypothetical protein
MYSPVRYGEKFCLVSRARLCREVSVQNLIKCKPVRLVIHFYKIVGL